MSLHQLITIVKPPSVPVEAGSPDKWVDVERRLGTALPGDYKAYIASYGTGSFDDFIMPFTPFASSKHLNLFQALDDLNEACRVHQLNFPKAPPSIVRPFELYPAKDGLLVCGATTNFGDYLFWQVEGDPESWHIVLYNLRDGQYEVIEEPFTGFLVGILSGTLKSSLLPEGFPGETGVEFEPLQHEAAG